MVKTTAQTLQAFGTELAETELPNDAEATTDLLHSHSLKKDSMKVRDAPIVLLFTSFPSFLCHSALSCPLVLKKSVQFNLQEDLQVALSQGARLLECINEPLKTDPEYNMTHDELENLATVQRYKKERMDGYTL